MSSPVYILSMLTTSIEKKRRGEVVLNTPWDNSILFFLLLIRGDKTTDEMNPEIPQSSFADKQV